MTAFARLSKSRFLIGLQCRKRLWWTTHEPDAPELVVESNSVALDRGRHVGELARAHVPGGTLIDVPHYEFENRIAATVRALHDGASVVYEASFTAGGVFVSVDMLERKQAGFALTEVKSTLDVKDEHLPDVAVQTHVLRAAGVDVKRVEIMHLNRECRHPALSKLFLRERVTTKVRPLLKAIPGQVQAMQSALDGPLPDVATGAHCDDPYPCPFKNRCWPELPEHHVSTLYRIRSTKADKLVAQGYETIADLPRTFKASAPAKRQIKSVKRGELVVERDLRSALRKIKEPIAFLDFETIMPAVPAWIGCHPYEQVPVQLSCHVLKNGKLGHHAWLADGPDDPRPGFAEALRAACEETETVVAYNASFEAQRIDGLVEAVPHLAPTLKKIRRRIRDLLPIVREHVYHPDFGGSFSLKAVLPALVAGLGYGDLEIHEGGTASALLERLLLHGETMTPEETAELRRNLLAYCERDTLAMVKLYARLGELAAGR